MTNALVIGFGFLILGQLSLMGEMRLLGIAYLVCAVGAAVFAWSYALS